MASQFQQQSLRRKIAYTVSIVAMLTVTLFLRGATSFGIDAQRKALELTEEDLGDVELTGSALRLSLSGSRGVAVCALWWSAQEKMMRNEWNELELIVNSLNKLQPHFIKPWLFQSWNLAYNVAVESDRIRDKYFYITRGIQVLAEGERQNKGNPDIRFYLGFYTQHKIGRSDEANTLRCLFEMSSMDPYKRDPNRLRSQDADASQPVDLNRFEEFCRANPRLVRRLREQLKKTTQGDIVDFLEDNQKIPSRYEDPLPTAAAGLQPQGTLKSADNLRQFPLLAPLTSDDRANPDDKDFDCFQVARDWYRYANEPLPPTSSELQGSMNPQFDTAKYRLPRYMALPIFRLYPCRAQTFVAEYLQNEGWFDVEGWLIKGWFPEDRFEKGPAVVGEGRPWAAAAWRKAHEMYATRGNEMGIYQTPERLSALASEAALYRDTVGAPEGGPPPRPPEDASEDVLKSYQAATQLFAYSMQRELTNFPFFYFTTEINSQPRTIELRKAFFEAEQAIGAADRDNAYRILRDAIPKWREIVLSDPDFRKDGEQQEQTYEIQLKYERLIRTLFGKRLQEAAAITYYLQKCLAEVTGGTALRTVLVPPPYVMAGVPPPVLTALDLPAPDGTPLIREEVKNQVRSRLGIGLPQPAKGPTGILPPAGGNLPLPQTPTPPPKPIL